MQYPTYLQPWNQRKILLSNTSNTNTLTASNLHKTTTESSNLTNTTSGIQHTGSLAGTIDEAVSAVNPMNNTSNATSGSGQLSTLSKLNRELPDLAISNMKLYQNHRSKSGPGSGGTTTGSLKHTHTPISGPTTAQQMTNPPHYQQYLSNQNHHLYASAAQYTFMTMPPLAPSSRPMYTWEKKQQLRRILLVDDSEDEKVTVAKHPRTVDIGE